MGNSHILPILKGSLSAYIEESKNKLHVILENVGIKITLQRS
jgi:hypothetical protein